MMRVLALAMMMSLGACGLQPMYAGGSSGAVARGLTTVQVAPIPERAGWFVRNALVDRLGGESSNPSLRLEVELDDDLIAFGIRGDSTTARESRILRARYRLIEIGTGQVVLDATAGSDMGIDVVSSEYATIAAEQTAQVRLASVIADQMVSRISLYVRHRAGEQ